MRSRCWGGVFEPVEPPVERPEIPTTPPSTEDLLTIKIEDDIMAVVGTNDWNAIAYGNGKYVAYSKDKYVTTSTDVVNWTTPKTPINDDINTISYCDGIFIAGGVNCCYYSADGIDWYVAYTGYEHFTMNAIAYHAGRIVAVGSIMENSYSRLAILTSNDKGISWTRTYTSTIIDDFKGVTYASGEYHAISNGYGLHATSTDGINWSTDYILGTGSSSYHAGKIAGDQNGHYVILQKNNSYSLWYFSKGDSIATKISFPFGSITSSNATGNEFYPEAVHDIIYANDTFIVAGYGYRNNYGMTPKTRGFISLSKDDQTWSDPVLITNESGTEVDKVLRGIVAIP